MRSSAVLCRGQQAATIIALPCCSVTEDKPLSLLPVGVGTCSGSPFKGARGGPKTCAMRVQHTTRNRRTVNETRQQATLARSKL